MLTSIDKAIAATLLGVLSLLVLFGLLPGEILAGLAIEPGETPGLGHLLAALVQGAVIWWVPNKDPE